jgi:hypothetical protein
MEGIMRIRLAALTLCLYLSVVVLGCSSKTSEPSSSNAPAESPATGSNAAPGEAEKSSGGAMSKPKAEAPKPVVVPAGTVLTVRLANAVGSKISTAGQTFTATVATPVEVEGKTVIPAGASASGIVVDAKPLGRFKGGASLQLKLNSVSVNGSDRAISTSSVVRTEKGKGKRTAVLAGGGAGLGALIGGLAGGGKGAAIGALAGAGAGTGGAAFTGNKDIVLPAESAVSFKLEEALEVK